MKILMFLNGDKPENIIFEDFDLLIAVDGGYYYFEKQGIIPDIFIGDGDSFKSKINENTLEIKLNPEKDKTDFKAACDYVSEFYGDSECFIYGGTGKRLDHF